MQGQLLLCSSNPSLKTSRKNEDETVPHPTVRLSVDPAFGIRADPRVFPSHETATDDDVEEFEDVCAAMANSAVPRVSLTPSDVAMLVYTSGTTGNPKGAISTHRAVALSGALGQHNMQHPDGATMLTIAPLFHITGLAMNVFTCFNAGAPQILSYRFHPDVVLEMIETHKPHSTVGAITAFTALENQPTVNSNTFSCLKSVGCGGAPMSPAAFKNFQDKFGIYLRNGYGMTETSGVAVMVPEGAESRIDPDSGALSVGKAVKGCVVTIIGDDDTAVEAGEVGEVLLRSDTVTTGYWGNDNATKESNHPLGFRTGDVGKLDEDGWLLPR